MPNWVHNKLEIRGREEEIKELLSKHIVKDDEELVFDFNTITPMPQDLKIEVSSRADFGIKLIEGTKIKDSKLTDKEYEECIALGQKALDNLKNYGYKNWYDWSIDNWGTK